MKSLHFCVGIPTYNSASYIAMTLECIYKQEYENFSVLISDDCSTDETVSIIKKWQKKNGKTNIEIFKNDSNKGCSRNFQILLSKARGDILYVLCQDDVLLPHAFDYTYKAFLTDTVGVVTRPYYWFDDEINRPQRAVYPPSSTTDLHINLANAPIQQIEKVVESIGQASGLAYRIRDMRENFHQDVFTTHIYPFMDIAKRKDIVFLHNFTVAVRIKSSQSRNIQSVYDKSPTESWINMFDSVFKGKKYSSVRRIGRNFILGHYVGLVQIRSYSTFSNFLREVYILVSCRWQNLLQIKFWFYTLVCLFTPRLILRKITDEYKRVILSRFINLHESRNVEK